MQTLFTLLGGLGLFLLGLHLMTDGLKAAAGDALTRYLARLTGGPLSAVGTGIAVTAMVQSSSATTLATIGFVSAGLLSFTQALGVVIGGSIGTTATGWLVATLGLKVSISAFALPLLGSGALMHIFGRGRLRMTGLALAGFGLIFVGIQTLQDGMTGLAAVLDVSRFSAEGVFQRLLLVGIGLLMTVIMQSSSAAVATTLAALAAGTIAFDQAAALVIGQTIGTTVTAAIAAIGASTAARRTSVAHILFNLTAASLAFLLFPLLRLGVDWAGAGAGEPIRLAMFHTTLMLLGAAVVLPLLGHFARLVERIVPQSGNPLARHLDNTLLQSSALALSTAALTVQTIATALFQRTARALNGEPRAPAAETAEREALAQVQQFLIQAAHAPDAAWDGDRYSAVLLALEHLTRMHELLGRMPDQIRREAHQKLFSRAAEAVAQAHDWAARHDPSPVPTALKEYLNDLERAYRRQRRRMVEADHGSRDPIGGLVTLRWLDHLLHHLRRALSQLEALGGRIETPPETTPGNEEPGRAD